MEKNIYNPLSRGYRYLAQNIIFWKGEMNNTHQLNHAPLPKYFTYKYILQHLETGSGESMWEEKGFKNSSQSHVVLF